MQGVCGLFNGSDWDTLKNNQYQNEMFSYAPSSELGVNVTPRGVHLTLEHTQ